MTGQGSQRTEDLALLTFLQEQRDVVLAIVAGLDEEAWHRSIVPSGWTPAGLAEHLGRRGVALVPGSGNRRRAPAAAPGADWPPMTRWTRWSATCLRPRSSPTTVTEIIANYRDQGAQSDAVLAVTPLSARPLGSHGDPDYETPDVRWVVLHT